MTLSHHFRPYYHHHHHHHPHHHLCSSNAELGSKMLLELSRFMPAELPPDETLSEITSLIRSLTPTWLLSADYSALLSGCRDGLSHKNPLLRQCWTRVLELLLHEHLARLDFHSLLAVFELSTDWNPNPKLKCRWLDALVCAPSHLDNRHHPRRKHFPHS